MPEHTPPTPAELAAWQAATDAATPGPWEECPAYPQWPSANGYYQKRAIFVRNAKEGRYSVGSIDTSWGAAQNTRIFTTEQLSWTTLKQTEANAQFIALSRTAIPRLLAEVTRLRSRVAALESAEEQRRQRVREGLRQFRGQPFLSDSVTDEDEL